MSRGVSIRRRAGSVMRRSGSIRRRGGSVMRRDGENTIIHDRFRMRNGRSMLISGC